MSAYDLSRYQRLIGVDGGRVTGTFWATTPVGGKDRSTIVETVDVLVWHDDEHTSARVLRSGDLSASIQDGDVDLRLHMIADDRRADVQDAWDEMVDALSAVAVAALRAVGGDRAA